MITQHGAKLTSERLPISIGDLNCRRNISYLELQLLSIFIINLAIGKEEKLLKKMTDLKWPLNGSGDQLEG